MLRVFLFGNVQISHDHLPATASKMTRTVQQLLAYLLIEPSRLHHRDMLASVAWADRPQDQARSCLSTALWRLRRILEPADTPRGTYLVTTGSGEVGFNWVSDHWVDARNFEQMLVPAARQDGPLSDADCERIEATFQLYKAELLEGFYDDWALRERERMRMVYLDGLARLMHHYAETGNCEKGLRCGERILAQDRLREDVHRQMMRLYLQTGQRAAAVRQYQVCLTVLADELGIPPMEETQALYREIVPEAPLAPPIFPMTPGVASDPHQILRQLQQAMADFERAQAALQTALRLYKQSMPVTLTPRPAAPRPSAPDCRPLSDR